MVSVVTICLQYLEYFFISISSQISPSTNHEPSTLPILKILVYRVCIYFIYFASSSVNRCIYIFSVNTNSESFMELELERRNVKVTYAAEGF